jgi:hypothetical protein
MPSRCPQIFKFLFLIFSLPAKDNRMSWRSAFNLYAYIQYLFECKVVLIYIGPMLCLWNYFAEKSEEKVGYLPWLRGQVVSSPPSVLEPFLIEPSPGSPTLSICYSPSSRLHGLDSHENFTTDCRCHPFMNSAAKHLLPK